ncbi:hypothetical protein K7X08_027290 [Anisodus acutangulus]|uniref:Uncharacterized protein n=1 Tax=Anisodus acutangulus TaxID=402998 RepID=A0A9Q1MIN5_9SOLA|nr:hypothetical protein K7X08_027290 [Anisodus acutangulus]
MADENGELDLNKKIASSTENDKYLNLNEKVDDEYSDQNEKTDEEYLDLNEEVDDEYSDQNEMTDEEEKFAKLWFTSQPEFTSIVCAGMALALSFKNDDWWLRMVLGAIWPAMRSWYGTFLPSRSEHCHIKSVTVKQFQATPGLFSSV